MVFVVVVADDGQVQVEVAVVAVVAWTMVEFWMRVLVWPWLVILTAFIGFNLLLGTGAAWYVNLLGSA